MFDGRTRGVKARRFRPTPDRPGQDVRARAEARKRRGPDRPTINARLRWTLD